MARHALDSDSGSSPSPSFSLTCPKDGTTMAKVDAGGIHLDRCTSCGAMWFDAKELESLRRNKAAAKQVDVGAVRRTDARVRTKQLRCPRDNEPLKEIEYPTQSHIMIMECETCGGHLLDAGEFNDLAAFSLGERIRNFFS